MNKSAVCTIVTKSYLPYARTLASSLAEHNPDIQLYVLLADRVDNYFDPSLEPFKLIYLENLSDQRTIEKMCFYYTTFELCCALRGALHEYMYQNSVADSWIFLDSDILIFSPLDEIFRQLESTSILLNPHLLDPLAEPYTELVEVPVLVCGLYNGGFLGLRASEEAKKFILWFKNRLTKYSFDRREQGKYMHLVGDQLWLNFVPLWFKNVSLLVLPGTNLAHWNLISGSLSKQNNAYFFNDKPVIFVHFTGWDIYNPSKLSKYLDKDINLWPELGQLYQKRLFKYGYEDCKQFPNSFSTFINGKPITPRMRFLYYEYLSSNKENAIDPFSNRNYLILKQLQRMRDLSILRNFKKLFRKLLNLIKNR